RTLDKGRPVGAAFSAGLPLGEGALGPSSFGVLPSQAPSVSSAAAASEIRVLALVNRPIGPVLTSLEREFKRPASCSRLRAADFVRAWGA
ncbi:MAG TPA: hypothetical protein VLC09_15675, partial [Polyangiaceae bacterium]|nr:hypothetical protein [Polyangiaceae bacterium]